MVEFRALFIVYTVLTDYRALWPEELAYYSDSSYNRDSPATALSRGIIVGVHPASRSLL